MRLFQPLAPVDVLGGGGGDICRCSEMAHRGAALDRGRSLPSTVELCDDGFSRWHR